MSRNKILDILIGRKNKSQNSSLNERDADFSRWFQNESNKCWDKMVPVFEKLEMTQSLMNTINTAPYVKEISVTSEEVVVYYFDATNYCCSFKKYGMKNLGQMETYILSSWIMTNLKNNENYAYAPMRRNDYSSKRSLNNSELWNLNMGATIKYKNQQVHLKDWN